MAGKGPSADLFRLQYQAVSALLSAPNLQAAAPGLLAILGAGAGADLAALWWAADADAALQPIGAWRASVSDTRTLEPSAAALRVWQRREACWVDGIDADTAGGRAPGGDARAAFLFAAATERRAYGVFELSSGGHSPPDQALAQALVALGRQIGQYCERLEEGARQLDREIDIRTRAEVALQTSEAKLRRLYQSDIIGIMVSDTFGHIKEANDVLLRMLGYSRRELDAGVVRWDQLTPPEWLPHDARAVDQLRRTGVATTWEKEYLRKDGTRLPILIGAALLEGSLTESICFVLDNTQRKKAERALARANEQLARQVADRTDRLRASDAKAEDAVVALARSQQLLKALAAHLHTIREEERAVLARQIHDVLGQELTGLKMDAAWVLRRIKKPSQPAIKVAAERLERMLHEIDATIDTVRRIATELRPGVLDDLGLVAALEWQAREFEARSGVRVEFTSPPEERAADKDRATALFRIFQELLTNVARHARARSVAASLTFAGEAMVLSVRDDGRGISDQEIGGSTSLGLAGINERALAFGGEFVISGGPGKGTEARVLIPLGARAEPTAGGGH